VSYFIVANNFLVKFVGQAAASRSSFRPTSWVPLSWYLFFDRILVLVVWSGVIMWTVFIIVHWVVWDTESVYLWNCLVAPCGQFGSCHVAASKPSTWTNQMITCGAIWKATCRHKKKPRVSTWSSHVSPPEASMCHHQKRPRVALGRHHMSAPKADTCRLAKQTRVTTWIGHVSAPEGNTCLIVKPTRVFTRSRVVIMPRQQPAWPSPRGTHFHDQISDQWLWS
jgi:hypothetical protein